MTTKKTVYKKNENKTKILKYSDNTIETNKNNELKQLTYNIPLAIHNINSKQLNEMLYSSNHSNYTVIKNKNKNTNKNTDIITNIYNENNFTLNYIVKDITLELIYIIQEQFILNQTMNNNDNFNTVLNKNNFKLFSNIINHPDPYFKAKLDNQTEFNYFINYSYDINIYDNILKNNINILSELKTNEPINIYSQFCEDGTIINSLLRLIKCNKQYINFIGSTYHKQAYEGYNELMNLYKMKKQKSETANLNNFINVKYTDLNEKNNFNFYYGDYYGSNIGNNSLDIIDTYLPTNTLFNNKAYNIKYIKPFLLSFIHNYYNLLKNNGLLILNINELYDSNIHIINNIITNVDKFELINSIRISNSNKISDHDKYIFIFKKINKILDTKIVENFINCKLPDKRTIKIVFDDCNNTNKINFNCDNGFFWNLHFLNKKENIKFIKDAGYTKLTYIAKFTFVDYEILFRSIKEAGLELTLIFLNLYISLDLSYLLQNMLYACKYKYNFEVLFMNSKDLEKYKSEHTDNYYFTGAKSNEDLILNNKNIYKEKLTPLFKNIKTVWHNESIINTKTLCTLFPNIQFKFIVNYHIPATHASIILNYKKLNLPNLKIYVPSVPFIPFPDLNYNSTKLLPNYAYYYSTLLKYAEDGDLFYSSYYV